MFLLRNTLRYCFIDGLGLFYFIFCKSLSSFGRNATQYNYKEFAISILISRIYMSANRWLYGVHFPALSAIVSLCHVLLGSNFTPPVNPYVTLSWVNHLRVWTGGPKSLNVVRCYRVGRSPCWALARESVLRRVYIRQCTPVYACKVEYLYTIPFTSSTDQNT